MDFKKLNSDHNCNCFENAIEDIENLYAIKANKNMLRIQDFASYWEKGRRPASDDCKEICSLKGVSISLFNDINKDEVVEIFKSLFSIAPKYRPYLIVFRFYESSGLIKQTPSVINKHHFDFYKCDTFDFSKVNIINANELH